MGVHSVLCYSWQRVTFYDQELVKEFGLGIQYLSEVVVCQSCYLACISSLPFSVKVAETDFRTCHSCNSL